MTQVANHQADFIAIADAVTSYFTLDFSISPYVEAVGRLESVVSVDWATSVADTGYAYGSMPATKLPPKVHAAALELYELCLQQYSPKTTNTFVFVYKNRNLSKLADIALGCVFHANELLLKTNDELHGRVIGAVTELLQLVMTDKVVSAFGATLFETEERSESPRGYLCVPKSYAELVGGSMLSRTMRQGYGDGSRTMITVLANFSDTADLQHDTKISFSETDTLGLKIFGHVVFVEPNASKKSFTRPGAVVLQVCIDHAALEDSSFFSMMDEVFRSLVGDEYPRFDNCPQSRIACALLFMLKQAKAK